ncbi:MAG: glycosyltransferase family 4 protein [Nostocaceae cyanobacterium]|nr:glycosyltransferase family 4 protein [Nostocaceae cyanobacterium]
MLKSLVKYTTETNHTFVLFSWAKDPPQEIATSNIQFISLAHTKSWQTALKIFKNLPLTKIQSLLEKSIFKSIFNSGVEINWYLSPWVCPTMNLPYITVVWDLEHRLQPYFPELSTEGNWDGREKSYAVRLRRAAIILTGTEAGKLEIERFYQVATGIKKLPLPTPSFALNAQPSDGKQVLAKYNIPEKYLFYPSQFWPHKNHVGLLLAVQMLRDKYDLVFPVVFAGSDKGNMQHVMQLVTELNLMTQVHFLGFVPQQDLISLYRHAFALTFLSFLGPDNLPPLEAFALSCPVVAANVSGAKEQLGDAALLVNPRDQEDIARAIKSLHDDKILYQTLIQRGLERASKWTGQDYVQEVLSVLDEFETIRRCWSSKTPYHGV